MPSYVTARIVASIEQRPGLHRVSVAFEPKLPDGHGALASTRAYALEDVSGPVGVGDLVVLNTTAVELDLGTGGWHVVVVNLDAPAWQGHGRGHVLKLRYTGMQTDTGVAEEHTSSGEPAVHLPLDAELDCMPVVAATLHSQVAGIAAAVKDRRPDARVAYVMTDGAALPLVLSDLVVSLHRAGLLDATITAGNAFGGEFEAVNVPSALAVARHMAEVDVAIVAMGPGVVGTGTRLGTSALEAAPTLDAVSALGGQPVFCARWSRADQRPRHHGLSHHARTVLELVRSTVTVPVPGALLDDAQVIASRHRLVVVEPPSMGELLKRLSLDVTTMGRGRDVEPEFFALCGAAGVWAADHVAS